MFLFQRCLSYRESNKGSKQRQGPSASVRFTEVSVVHAAKSIPVSTVHAKGTPMAIIKCGTKAHRARKDDNSQSLSCLVEVFDSRTTFSLFFPANVLWPNYETSPDSRSQLVQELLDV